MNVRIMQGDALSKLAELPDESVHCVVTSPPYWGLRRYKGDPGMIGLEPTFDDHLANLVVVFREVWRVLRSDGCLFLNYGDAYASQHGKQSDTDDKGLRDSTDRDSSSQSLCDECVAALLHHNPDSTCLDQESLGVKPSSNRGRKEVDGDHPANLDSSPLEVRTEGAFSVYPHSIEQSAAVALDAQVSTTQQSLRQPRVVCSHCPNCGACQSVLRSSDPYVLLCARTGWRLCTCDTEQPPRSCTHHSSGNCPSSGAWGYSTTSYLKPKDLMLMSTRVAIALQQDGWWLRSEIIWHKPNAMPESVTDRPTSSHEKIFLMSKSGSPLFWTHRGEFGVRHKPKPDYRWVHRKTHDEVETDPQDSATWRRVNLWSGHDYFYDAVAIRTARVTTEGARGYKMPAGWATGPGAHGTVHPEGREEGQYEDKQSGHSRRHAGFNERWKKRHEPPRHSQYKTGHQGLDSTGRGSANLRNVWFPDLDTIWTFATQPFKDAHFATFPASLVIPCIEAGTSQRGVCVACGAPWHRDTERRPTEYDGSKYGAAADQNKPRPRGTEMSTLGSSHGEGTANYETKGWQPTCGCVQRYCESCTTVLDSIDGKTSTSTVGSRISLRRMREDVSSRPPQDTEGGDVFEDLRGTVQREESTDNKGMDDYNQGVQVDPDPQSSERNKVRVRDGASTGDGEASGALPDQERGGSSQEREASGQPNRESGVDEEAAARRAPKADVLRNVPLLRSDLSDPGSCPHCGRPTIWRTPNIKPAVVLDCFAGSGTVGLVADRLGRDAILIEINDEYAEMAEDRIRNDAPLFAHVEKE